MLFCKTFPSPDLQKQLLYTILNPTVGKNLRDVRSMNCSGKKFFFDYLRSMRLYYCFVSGSTVLAGMVFCQREFVWGWRSVLLLVCGFAAWGINQIFNDYFDLDSDRINAPRRPMASGALDIRKALTLSTVLMLLLGLVSLAISPVTLLAAAAGGGLNLLYSKLKKIPFLNCLIYSSSLSCCAWYGYAGICGSNYAKAFSFDALMITLVVMPVHFFMCSMSYYKDKKGDRAAGVCTLQNLLPDKVTLPLHFAALGLILWNFLSRLKGEELILESLVLLILFFELFYYLYKKEYHPATKINCQFCTVWLLFIAAEKDWHYYFAAAGALVLTGLFYNWEPLEEKRFVTGLEKLLFYCRMSLGCALKFRSIPLIWKAGKFTKVFFCHKLLQLPTGEYKLDFYMPRYPSEAFFTAMKDKLCARPPRPVSVVWSVTKACRYRCPHCYQGFDSTQEMPLEKMLQAAKAVRDSGVSAWAVEGGEVMLRFERTTALLEEIKGLEVWVNSTGDGATPEKIARLKELEVTGVMSSIHSISPEKHDAFTGVPGSFSTALGFLELCSKAGMLTGFNTVLTDEEIIAGKIDDIMALAAEVKCDYIQLIHPKSCGRWGNMTFDTSRHEQAVKIACEAQKKYNSFRRKNAPILTAQVFEESPQMLGCTAGGIDRFYVGCSGEVQPCEFVNVSFGNLCSEPYEVIYERMRRAFPVPGCDWICCKYASAIASAIEKNGGPTPLPAEETEKLVKNWSQGAPTPVYERMGIYK